MVLIKTAIINVKNNTIEHKTIEGEVIAETIEEKSDQTKLIEYAKSKGWI
jgi:hypothetical protein